MTGKAGSPHSDSGAVKGGGKGHRLRGGRGEGDAALEESLRGLRDGITWSLISRPMVEANGTV